MSTNFPISTIVIAALHACWNQPTWPFCFLCSILFLWAGVQIDSSLLWASFKLYQSCISFPFESVLEYFLLTRLRAWREAPDFFVTTKDLCSCWVMSIWLNGKWEVFSSWQRSVLVYLIYPFPSSHVQVFSIKKGLPRAVLSTFIAKVNYIYSWLIYAQTAHRKAREEGSY